MENKFKYFFDDEILIIKKIDSIKRLSRRFNIDIFEEEKYMINGN